MILTFPTHCETDIIRDRLLSNHNLYCVLFELLYSMFRSDHKEIDCVRIRLEVESLRRHSSVKNHKNLRILPHGVMSEKIVDFM